MPQRRRFKQTQTLEERLAEEAKRLREEANVSRQVRSVTGCCAEPGRMKPPCI